MRVEPVASGPGDRLDDTEPETADQIDDWLRWYHTLEPLEFTPQEEADLAAWRPGRSTVLPLRNSDA